MPLQLTESFISQRLMQNGHPSYFEIPPEQLHGPLRRAAVLVPMTMVGDEWHLLYTRRTDHVEHHKSQVAFPGGATDPDDPSAEATALREADEEVGIRPADVRILGALGELVTITNFLVTPVVGVIPWPYGFKISTREVNRVFTMPLSYLADKRNYQEFLVPETGRSVITYFPYDGELLWGATARITVNFVRLLGLL